MLSVGVHITKNSVYFAGLSIGGVKPEIRFIEERFFTDQKEEGEKALFISDFTEKIYESHKGEALRFCYGLSQDVVTSFFVQLPFKEKFKIIRTLPFEIEDQTPFQSNKVFFDARLCKIKDQKESLSVCFVTPEENVKEFADFSGKLSKKPYLLSCEAPALANVLESWNKPLSQIQNADSHQFYLYLGMDNSQLLFYKKGHLEYISVLDWSAGLILKDMEKFYKLDAKKAWEEFYEKSFILTSDKGFSKEQIFFSNLIKKRVHHLINRMQLLRMSFETERKTAMEEVVLSGPGAVVKNLTAFLTAETSMTFSKLKAFELFPFHNPQEKPSALIALGLALEGLKRAPYEGVNFLKSTNKESLSLFPKVWRKTAFAVFLVFFILTIYAFLRKEESRKIFESVQPVFASYGKRIAFMEGGDIPVREVKSFLEKERGKVHDEKLIRRKLDAAGPMDKIQLLTQRLGGAEKWNLTIAYLKVEGNTAQIKGSLNKSSLKSFKSQLEALAKGRIKEASIEKLKEPPKGGKPSDSLMEGGKENFLKDIDKEGKPSGSLMKGGKEKVLKDADTGGKSSDSLMEGGKEKFLRDTDKEGKPSGPLMENGKGNPKSKKDFEGKKSESLTQAQSGSGALKEDLKKEDLAFFSYTFDFKEGL